MCYICMEETNERVIYPCACKGDGVHPSCLLAWMEASKRSSCEICLEKYRGLPRHRDFTPFVNTVLFFCAAFSICALLRESIPTKLPIVAVGMTFIILVGLIILIDPQFHWMFVSSCGILLYTLVCTTDTDSRIVSTCLVASSSGFLCVRCLVRN